MAKETKLKIFEVFFLFLCVSINLCGYSQQTIKDFYLSNFKEDGTRDWEIKGDEAIIYDTYVDIDKMRAKYYSKDDTISIRSEKAKMQKGAFNVFLKENVHIENKDGITLDTDSLSWMRNKNRIQTRDFVQLKRDQMQITAKGLDADTELKTADFKKNVEVKYPQEKTGDVITVTCKGPLEVEYNKGKAIFHKDVVVTSKDGKMFSDLATIFFDSEAKLLTKIVARGHVKITREDNVVYAYKAIYLAAEEKLILKGSPQVVYFPDSLDKSKDRDKNSDAAP